MMMVTIVMCCANLVLAFFPTPALISQAAHSKAIAELNVMRLRHAAKAEECLDLSREIQQLKQDLQWVGLGLDDRQKAPSVQPQAALAEPARPGAGCSHAVQLVPPALAPTAAPPCGIAPQAKYNVPGPDEATPGTGPGSHAPGRGALAMDPLPARYPQASVPAAVGSGPSAPATMEHLGPLPQQYYRGCHEWQIAVNQALLHSLPRFPEDLRELDLSQNYIGRKGVMCLSDLMSACVNLKTVNLADNKLDNDAVTYFASKAAKHPTLQSITLRNNLFSKAGGRALLQAVQINTNITDIVIENEPFLIPSLKQRIQEQVLLNRQYKNFSYGS